MADRPGPGRWGLVVAVAMLVAALPLTVWLVAGGPGAPAECTAGSTGGSGAYTLTPEQARNAATISAVGARLGLPDHATSVALAAALQESELRNLTGGDRDSLGLFQQRPSQGWGTRTQILDPVYASTSFYRRLAAEPGWEQRSVTDAAQKVQRSAAPGAYARWEGEARTVAAALTGETAAGFTCHGMTVSQPTDNLVTVAAAELGTSAVSGNYPSARGWAVSSWLVAQSENLGIERVTFDGRTWTAVSGTWTLTGPSDGLLSLRRAPS